MGINKKELRVGYFTNSLLKLTISLTSSEYSPRIDRDLSKIALIHISPGNMNRAR